MALTKISRSLLDTGVSDSSDATAITIDSSENVGIANTSPVSKLDVTHTITSNTGDSIASFGTSGSGGWANSAHQVIVGGPSLSTYTGLIISSDSTSGNGQISFADGKGASDSWRGYIGYNHASDFMTFGTNANEVMRFSSAGAVLIGQTSSAQPVVSDIAGIGFSASGLAEFQVNGGTVMRVGRLTNDGDLVEFRAQTSVEGKISVSGSTVSYEGFSGCHESSGIATDTVIGTVCSTIDELDTYVSGNKSGQTRAEHAKIKVSDTVGDSRVYGVLTRYSETDNKPIVSSVGLGSVRVTGACNGGDLLESNGDGTAKVQDDDIIRSKTIGKVTIGNSNAGVKLVSCVLYCG